MRCAIPTLCSFTILVMLTLPTPAVAQTQRVVVEDFRGPRSGLIRSRVVRDLRDHNVSLVSRDEVATTARRLGVSLNSPREYSAVAARLRVAAFVSGRIRRMGRRVQLTLTVRDGYTGEVATQSEMTARRPPGLARLAARRSWPALGETILGTSAPPADAAPARDYDVSESEAGVDNEVPPPPDYSTDDIEEGRRRNLDPELYGQDDEAIPAMRETPAFVPEHTPLEVYAGLGLLNRGFSYTGNGDGLPSYDLPLGPAAHVGFEWYPGAHVQNDGLAMLGLTFDFASSIGLSSDGPNGVSYPTSDQRWSVGARARLPVGGGRLHADVRLGSHLFEVEPAFIGDGEPPVASVDYTHLELGLGARIPMGAATLHLSGAWLPVTGLGEIGSRVYWPDASAMGFGGNIGLGYELFDGFSLRGAVDGRFYLLDFGQTGGGPDGALDRHLGVTIGAAWTMEPLGF